MIEKLETTLKIVFFYVNVSYEMLTSYEMTSGLCY